LRLTRFVNIRADDVMNDQLAAGLPNTPAIAMYHQENKACHT